MNALSTAFSNDVLVEAAKMVMNDTRPTPIMSAVAVAAVRFGLRMAFSRARCPAMPRARGSGQPIKRLIGSDTVRPRTDTPKKTMMADPPMMARAFDGDPSRP